MTKQRPKISDRLDFDFYDNVWCIYKKNPSRPDDNIILGQWLGISHKTVSKTCYWVLTVSGKVIARTTVHHVVHTEFLDTDMKGRIEKFDE